MDIVTLQAAKADALKTYAKRRRGLPYAQIGIRSQVPTNLASDAVVKTSSFTDWAIDACTDLRVVYAHWAPGPSEADIGGTITFKASFYDGTNVMPFYFGGNLIATHNGGLLISDPLGVELAAGQQFWIRTYLASGTAWAVHVTSGAQGASGEGRVAASDLTAAGSGAVSGSTVINTYGPSAVLGTFVNPTSAKPLVALVGDSIIAGQGNDDLFNGAGAGFMVQALGFDATAIAHRVTIATPSERCSHFVATSGHRFRMSLAADAKYAVMNYGINDILTGGSTTAQLEANQGIAWKLLANRGMKVFQTTITPKATSTDSWTTLANQTTDPTNATRVAVNQWLRAGAPLDPAALTPVAVGTSGAVICDVYDATKTKIVTASGVGHPLVAVFDVAGSIESAQDSGKWAIPTLRTVSDAAMTSGSTTLTSATANFTNADKGKIAVVAGAGAAGATLLSPIMSVQSTTSATVNVNASTTVSAAALTVGVPTKDGTHPSGERHRQMATAIPTGLFV